jgi:hypothetical protein
MFPNTWLTCTKKSLKDPEKAKGSYETPFNNKSNEATTSGKIHEKIEMPNLMVADYIDMKNTIVEYNSDDVFGTLIRLHLSL